MGKTDKFDAAEARHLTKKSDRQKILPEAKQKIQSEILPKIKKRAAEGKDFADFILYEREEKNYEPEDPCDKENERECNILGEFCVNLLSQLGFEAGCETKTWSSESEFGITHSGWKIILRVQW